MDNGIRVGTCVSPKIVEFCDSTGWGKLKKEFIASRGELHYKCISLIYYHEMVGGIQWTGLLEDFKVSHKKHTDIYREIATLGDEVRDRWDASRRDGGFWKNLGCFLNVFAKPPYDIYHGFLSRMNEDEIYDVMVMIEEQVSFNCVSKEIKNKKYYMACSVIDRIGFESALGSFCNLKNEMDNDAWSKHFSYLWVERAGYSSSEESEAVIQHIIHPVLCSMFEGDDEKRRDILSVCNHLIRKALKKKGEEING